MDIIISIIGTLIMLAFAVFCLFGILFSVNGIYKMIKRYGIKKVLTDWANDLKKIFKIKK